MTRVRWDFRNPNVIKLLNHMLDLALQKNHQQTIMRQTQLDNQHPIKLRAKPNKEPEGGEGNE